MPVTGLLSALIVKISFKTSPDQLLGWVGARFSNPSRPLQKALGNANENTWKTLGLALAGDSLFDRLSEAFPGVDLSTLRRIHQLFLDGTPTGLDSLPLAVRVRACRELARQRNVGKLTLTVERSNMIEDLWRCGDPAKWQTEAPRVVEATADLLTADAPNLAKALRVAASGRVPLSASAFAYFFHRELLANPDLARGATPENLRSLTVELERGLSALLEHPGGPADQFDTLFNAYANWCDRTLESLDWLRSEVRQWRESNRVETIAAEAPLPAPRVPEAERSWVRLFQDRLRQIPPEVVEAADWQGLGCCFDACGLYEEAFLSHAVAAAKAGGDGDAATEGENAFRAYKTACLTGKWPEAKEFLLQAARLDPRRFRPFDMARFILDAVLSCGPHGPIFRCFDTEDLDEHGNPLPVIVESLHLGVTDLRTALAEARTLRDLHRPRSPILRVYGWGFADSDPDNPNRKQRPYLILEDFPGESLAALSAREEGFPRAAFLATVYQIAEALAGAHKRNVLHRGLTPFHVRCRPVGEQWEVKVAGFIVSRGQVDPSTPNPFAAPEQRGQLPGTVVGPHTDVFAFGKTCLQLLFRTPEPTGSHWETLPHDVREPLRLLLETATQPLPELRFPNFTPVLSGLRNLISPPKPEPIPVSQAVAPPVVSNRTEVAQSVQEPALSSLSTDPGSPAPSRQLDAAASEATAESEDIPVLDPADEAQALPENPPYVASSSASAQTTEVKHRDPLDPARLRSPGERFTIRLPGDNPLTFAWCPPGTFEMGNPRDDAGSDERPAHNVTLTKGFFISIYPVTQGQWNAAQMGDNPSRFVGANRPVEQVLWDETQRFCRRITRQLKGKAEVRLPTEAQWEYACRAGTDTDYYTGDGEAALKLAGWYESTSGKQSQPVGQLAPNAWGLYDMHGNVWEWCQDWYSEYTALPQVDPVGPETGSDRVFRGGGWGDSARFCRSRYRSWFDPAVRYDALGFRVVMLLTG